MPLGDRRVSHVQSFDAIVLGAGPAGSGLLVNALMRGTANQLLTRGVLWADQGAAMGPGALGGYAIGSDTMAKVFVECLQGAHNPMAELAEHPAARLLTALDTQSAPLAQVGHFLKAVGAFLETTVHASTKSRFWPHHRARLVHRQADGGFVVHFDGGRRAWARKVVFALGGWHDAHYAATATIAPGVAMSLIPAQRRLASHHLLCHGGEAWVAPWLGAEKNPKIVIIGASHSALSAAALLLRTFPGAFAAEGSITILCRKPPKLFYPSAKDAAQDGYTAFTQDDVCPATHRVFRLAGLRLDSRDLFRRMQGLGNLPVESRCRLRTLDRLTPDETRALLCGATGVITAFGYRPTTVPILDVGGTPQHLGAELDARLPLVNDACEVLDAKGAAMDGLFALGLASGFVPRGPALGGEASFTGQANGLWLYQHDLGDRLVARLLA